MRKIKTSPREIWSEFEEAKQYNDSIELYSNVERNENFYNGNQWEGVKAEDLDKPVFNVIKRVINMFLAQIVSDDISISITPFNSDYPPELESFYRAVKTEIERCFEYTKFKTKNRMLLRNAAVDGDGCYHWYFNGDVETGQEVKGAIECELIDNTNVFFGNPNSNDVQSQPYIMILQRKNIWAVQDEAKRNGVSQDEIDLIKCDSENNLINDDKAKNLVSVIIKYWRDEKGIIHAVKTTSDTTIRKEWTTNYRAYPISYMSWEEVKNSYHGQSAVTERIPNQLFINKIFAMAMYYVKVMSFPKLVYDVNRLPNGLSNRIGEAIAVEGNVNEAIASVIQFPDMSSKVMELAEKTMQYTQEYMGASDATLGNMKPDNATAIIALQSSSNAPLELIKQSFHQLVEDSVRIIIDLMRCHYGPRNVYMGSADDINSNDEALAVDFSAIGTLGMQLNIDVGASSYWSEIMQVQTLDAMFANGIIVNPVDYLNALPDKYVRNKQKLIDSLLQAQNQQMAGGAMQSMDTAAGTENAVSVPQDIPYDPTLAANLEAQGISDAVINRAVSG